MWLTEFLLVGEQSVRVLGLLEREVG